MPIWKYMTYMTYIPICQYGMRNVYSSKYGNSKVPIGSMVLLYMHIYIWYMLTFTPNVSIYTPYMDPMGYGNSRFRPILKNLMVISGFAKWKIIMFAQDMAAQAPDISKATAVPAGLFEAWQTHAWTSASLSTPKHGHPDVQPDQP